MLIFFIGLDPHADRYRPVGVKKGQEINPCKLPEPQNGGRHLCCERGKHMFPRQKKHFTYRLDRFCLFLPPGIVWRFVDRN